MTIRMSPGLVETAQDGAGESALGVRVMRRTGYKSANSLQSISVPSWLSSSTIKISPFSPPARGCRPGAEQARQVFGLAIRWDHDRELERRCASFACNGHHMPCRYVRALHAVAPWLLKGGSSISASGLRRSVRSQPVAMFLLNIERLPPGITPAANFHAGP